VITGWVAGTVRARAMARRRLGQVGARSLAGSASLETALELLAEGPYGHDVRSGQSLAHAQHAVRSTLLWNLRVLAGWLPREGVAGLRALAAWFELLNVDDHLRQLAGEEPLLPPYQLGTLATAWPRLARTRTQAELRQVLATSPWRDPGDESPHQVRLLMRATYAERVAATVPHARPWAVSALALLLARETFLVDRPPAEPLRSTAGALLGAKAAGASSLAALRDAARPDLRELLSGADDLQDLWRLEFDWWKGVERDAFGLLRRPRHGPGVVCGALALLAVDAWRVSAALELAARGGSPLEVFDVVA
jgi:hypothetical protein